MQISSIVIHHAHKVMMKSYYWRNRQWHGRKVTPVEKLFAKDAGILRDSNNVEINNFVISEFFCV